MLHEFLHANHDELLRRCRAKATQRLDPALDPKTADNGLPIFLRQLTDTLRVEQTTAAHPVAASQVADPMLTPAATEIGRAAALHGTELLRLGFTVDQVVHGYGDLCQAVTGLAVERKAPISTDEFRTLNRCLDNAIADAVTAYGAGSAGSAKEQEATLSDRLNVFGDEQRRLVDIAIKSFSAIRTGSIGMGGATGALLSHALEELRALPERILQEIDATGAATAAPQARKKASA